MASVSFSSAVGVAAFCFGLGCFIDYSSEGAVFFLFFFFLSPDFYVDYTEFIKVVARAVDLVVAEALGLPGALGIML